MERWEKKILPYSDNPVNLMVVRDESAAPDRDELCARWLCPMDRLFVFALAMDGSGLTSPGLPRWATGRNARHVGLRVGPTAL